MTRLTLFALFLLLGNLVLAREGGPSRLSVSVKAVKRGCKAQAATRQDLVVGQQRTVSSPPPSPPPSASPDNSIEQQSLSAHKSARAQYGAKPLQWSDDLAGKASQWANGCLFQHSGGIFGDGENLAAGESSIDAAVGAWMAESSSYNPKSPNYSHFTQVVWKSTTQVGCAWTSCSFDNINPGQQSSYYVCEYSPAGNVIGQFAQNVTP